jgi:radical SAM superfamily enzyme YgiQ (UPF0313 family)
VRILFAVPRSYNPKQMYREYPLGAGYLGTLLKQQSHEIRIFDENVETSHGRTLLQQVADFRPEIVGFSVITPNYPVARQQIRALKEAWPQLQIMAGGVHATLFPEDLIRDGADVVVLGEGEPVIAQLVASLTSQRSRLAQIPGLVFRDESGQDCRTVGRLHTTALDDLPFVDRSLYNLPRYTHHSVLASRGCPHHCAFCCNYTGTVRSQGVGLRGYERVIAEIEYLRDTYGAREIFFADDIFLLRKPDILAFCEAYATRQMGVRWIGQMRADRVDERIAEAMAAAECQRVYFGVESGSDQILRRASKGMTVDQLRRGIHATINSGLRVKTGWIYGLPGSLEEQYESIDFMLELRPHEISIHQLIPFPGTVYYEQPGQFGIHIADPKNFESFCYGGLDGNIRFDYLSHSQLVRLLADTAASLEAAGYVSSDQATGKSEFIYTTPLCRNSMNVFRPVECEVAA